MTDRMNALWNCKNTAQGKFDRVLCVCSAGLLRSPTIAWVLSNRGCNTRAAGVYDYALVPVDEVLIEWCDYIICADAEHKRALEVAFGSQIGDKKVHVLSIPDRYTFRHPVLVDLIKEKLDALEDVGVEGCDVDVQ